MGGHGGGLGSDAGRGEHGGGDAAGPQTVDAGHRANAATTARQQRRLGQEVSGKRYIYTPLISMAECVRRESESFLDRVLGRAPSEAILHLVKRAELSKEDIQELRQILREKEK